MEFLAEYGLFIAKLLTFLLFIMVVIGLVVGGRKKGLDDEGAEVLNVVNLNKKYDSYKSIVQEAVLDKKALKKSLKSEKKANKAEKKAKDKPESSRLFVLDFKGDVKASAVASLREEVSAVIGSAKEGDEVFMRLENSGGAVHEHGLAASQLVRLKDSNIPLTISVDRVAASGGYMMACVADKILAAPFAALGSIGVLAQLPNFHRLLDKAGVDFEQHTAGEYKRNVTMFGKNTDKEREHLQSQIDDIHTLFRGFVSEHRSSLDMDKVGTGEYWYGKRALELGLVDELQTSDDYLMNAASEKSLYSVKMKRKKTKMQKLFGGGADAMEQFIMRLLKRNDI